MSTVLAPLLVAPMKRTGPPALERFLAGTYTLGWLVAGEPTCRWMTWGNSKDKDNAMKVVAETLAKQGPREVLIWDEPLPKDIPAETVDLIRRSQPDNATVS